MTGESCITLPLYKQLPNVLFFYIFIVEMIRIVIIGMLATVAMGQSKFAVKFVETCKMTFDTKECSFFFLVPIQDWNHTKIFNF